MNEMLIVLATWLTLGQGLPPMQTPPTVVFLEPDQMIERRHATIANALPATDVASSGAHRSEI